MVVNNLWIIMKTHKLLFLFTITAFCTFSCVREGVNSDLPVQEFITAGNPERAGFYQARLDLIDTVLTDYVKKGILPNAVTFVARKGIIVHHKAYGWKNIEDKTPVSKYEIFRIASQTKAITSVALMTLFEEGKFLLDDPVSKYIPDFENVTVLESFNDKDTSYTARPATGKITIRHLLNHTSGIHYGILRSGQGNMMYAKAGIPAVCSLEPLTIEEVSMRIAKMPLMFEPGEKYLYGMNTDICAYLIEILSGKPFDVFLKERIFDPLGMKDTYFYLPVDKVNRLVTLYSSSPQGLVKHENDSYQNYPVSGAKTLFLGGAGLCGTIQDYASFCQMLLNGGIFNGNRIISRKTVDLMTMNQIGEKSIGGGMKFGLGFGLYGEAGAASHLVSGKAYRWGGLYHTNYLIDPEEDLIMLFYTNVHPHRGPNTHWIFHNLVYQALK